MISSARRRYALQGQKARHGRATVLRAWSAGRRYQPGTVKNQLFAALDWVPTFVDIAGGPRRSHPEADRGRLQDPGIVDKISNRSGPVRILKAVLREIERATIRSSRRNAVLGGPRQRPGRRYHELSQPGPAGWIMPLVPFHFTLVQNIKRDPFEQAVGIAPEVGHESGRRSRRSDDSISVMTGTCCPSANSYG